MKEFPTKKKYTRRDALVGSFLVVGSAAANEVETSKSITPTQIEGPFYPDMDNNLTKVMGSKKKPIGKTIYVHGKVSDKQGKPVERAVVEIWQTDNKGIYNHAGDPRQADRDINFQFFGRSVTDKNGRYVFKTIKPAAYGVRDDWQRPPHIHFKVYRRGFEDLTTQLYFSGDPLNIKDGIYNNIPEKNRKNVTVDFNLAIGLHSKLVKYIGDQFGQKKGIENSSTVGLFDIVINTVV